MMMYDSIVYAPDITFNFPTTHTHILYTIGNNEVPASPTARDQMMLIVRNFYLYRVGGMHTLLNVKLWVCVHMPSLMLNVMDGGQGALTPSKLSIQVLKELGLIHDLHRMNPFVVNKQTHQ